MTNLRDSFWAVEVPDGLLSPAFEIEQTVSAIVLDKQEYELVIRYTERRCGSPIGRIAIDLPPGTWQIICTSKEATEEVLKPLDEILQHNYFKEWFMNFERRLSYFTNRVGSLNSLLASKGLTGKNYLIIKKV